MHRLLATSLALIAVMATPAFSPSPSAMALEANGYEPVASPQRLLDTRAGQPTVDGNFSGVGKRSAQSRYAVGVAGRAGLGTALGSVVINITVDQPEAAGFVTVWPCDQPRPNASNVNYSEGQTVGVAAITRVATDGTICLFTRARSHLIVDVAGHFPVGTFAPLVAPERFADTRTPLSTIDGNFAGQGRLVAGSVFKLRVAGRGTVPSDATAVALSVTATGVDAHGYLTVFPCGPRRPTASNVNYEPGSTTPNAVITRLDGDGNVCIFTLKPVHLVVDVAGSIGQPLFQPLAEPRRILETRSGLPTFDGMFTGTGQQSAAATLQLDVAGRAGVPADATAVVLNVTSTGSASPGFITSHPGGSSRPASSNLNYSGGRTVANMVISALGPGGEVCLYNLSATHIVVDVAGWLTGPPAPASSVAPTTTPCPFRTPTQSADTYRYAVVRRPALHRVVGTDRIGVYVCKIPTDSRQFDGSQQHSTTSQQFADFATTEVAPYFASASGGRYTVEFTPLGNVTVGRDATASDCLDEATSRTAAPFTNVLVAGSTSDEGGGFASPGTIFPSRFGPDRTVFEVPPSQSDRGGWLGGSVISSAPDPATIVHEIGHTIHWPHSFIGPDSEYDNPTDVMSSGQATCRTDRFVYPCRPGNTLAFNRFAGGWLRSGQVITHPSGMANYRLDPPGGSGLQLVVLPDPGEALSVLTFEARPAVGQDDFFEQEGVAVHIVDQVSRFGGLSGLSTARVQRQATGTPDSYEHVVAVGDALTVRGVRIEVVRRVGNSYEVQVTGSYQMPTSGFFTESIDDVVGRSTCASLPIDAALASGCTR